MEALTIILWVVFVLFFGIQVFAFFYLHVPPPRKGDWEPTVAVLLAARNEEKLILRNLRALAALDYPPEKLEIWIGDDDSQDQTAELIQQFIADKTQFNYVKIKGQLGLARGKANVLAHLAHQTQAEVFFITDVDVKVGKLWVRELLSAFNTDTGIVSGTTTCAVGKPFALLQSMDWLHFMGYIKSFANAGVSCTSVGNNMAVRTKAYFETGGYEKLKFSITEDYRLFDEVTKIGWGWSNVLSKGSMGEAWYIPSPGQMWHQRKRWLLGAKELPLNWKLMIILYGLFAPAMLCLLLINVQVALYVWILKLIVQTGYIFRLRQLTGLEEYPFLYFLIYEGYVILNTVATAIFYVLPISTDWKGREYSGKGLVG